MIDLNAIKAERCRAYREGSKCEGQCTAGQPLAKFGDAIPPCFGPTVAGIHAAVRLPVARPVCPHYSTQPQLL